MSSAVEALVSPADAVSHHGKNNDGRGNSNAYYDDHLDHRERELPTEVHKHGINLNVNVRM